MKPRKRRNQEIQNKKIDLLLKSIAKINKEVKNVS